VRGFDRSDGKEDDAQSVGSAAGGGWNERATQEVAGNVVHVVALLAREFGQVQVRPPSLARYSPCAARADAVSCSPARPQLQRLVVSTLQHHAANGGPAVVSAALYELAELAALSDTATFVEIVRSVSAAARAASSNEDPAYQAVRGSSSLSSFSSSPHSP